MSIKLNPTNFIIRQINHISEEGWTAIRIKLKRLCLLPFEITMLIIALPFVAIIRLLSPFLTIRLALIDIGRIGGLYICDLYLSEKECGNHQGPYSDWFYFIKVTSNHVNEQWEKMWARKLNVLFLSGLPHAIERLNKLFPGFEKYQISNSDFMPSLEEHNNYMTGKDSTIYAKYNKHLECVLRDIEPNLSFTPEEIQFGDRYLQKIGIPSKAPFICFHNRDSAFLDSMKSNYAWNYHSYRDSNIENYLSASEEMIRRGYYAVRLGSVTIDKIKITNAKLIDYANSEMRTDFLDIYLSAKCKFFICSDTGLSFPAEVFKRPLVYVNWTMILRLPVYALNGLIIFKKFYLRNEDRYMTFSEIINLEFGGSNTNEIFSDLGLEVIENTSEEIYSAAIEMDERLNGTWVGDSKDEDLQKRFWSFFGPEKLKSPNLRIGAKYLRNNKDLLN